MTITYHASGEITEIRGVILAFLKKQKALFPNYKVIDIGGGANAWADEYVDSYVDICEFNTDKKLFVGNICESKIWSEIANEVSKYDFSICTHVFEDIRDPSFVAKGLMTISKAGFISMPNKHTEMSNIESPAYLGYCHHCHHRWIFDICNGSNSPYLRGIAKFPIVNYWNTAQNPLIKFIHLLGKHRLGEKINRRIGFIPGLGGLDWFYPN